MPAKLEGGTGVVARRCIRQPHAGILLYRSVAAQKFLNQPNLLPKRRQRLIRQRHHPVPSTLAIDDPHLPVIEVNILDPQTYQFDAAQPGAVTNRSRWCGGCSGEPA